MKIYYLLIDLWTMICLYAYVITVVHQSCFYCLPISWNCTTYDENIKASYPKRRNSRLSTDDTLYKIRQKGIFIMFVLYCLSVCQVSVLIYLSSLLVCYFASSTEILRQPRKVFLDNHSDQWSPCCCRTVVVSLSSLSFILLKVSHFLSFERGKK